MTLIILTRHGQTEWNQTERFRGRIDVPLNETGKLQAEMISERIAVSWQPTAVYASPMSRAMHTGHAIATRWNLTVEPVAELNDINYGEWQGLTPLEVRPRWPDLLDTWYTAPHLVSIPGGESLAELLNRTSLALAAILKKHSDETVVLVGHDSVNRVILLNVLGLPLARYWHLSQNTCTLNIIESRNDDFFVHCINDTSHLVRDGIVQ
jgi:probable phosphoglycerate mutase